ncbi:FAD-dependent oxidoreductase [Phytoactinopolyspora halotolerans]|uniref:FAD-dependent oxidoreductase n=1 Tax=Phytoactinopolyspora halotolerans TaxID=1981512 RepID=A0A6L9SI50_9ACTN|nr:FAD-dependent oxidoreductase [Phytoactinopolyspora halotolerans]NEE04314.1 FAD-dependent oxidoreductase [Phytoactinopolyspora halotolerans]
MLPTTTDVLVIGAGPTGLTLALWLAGSGHSVTVVDDQAAGDNTSRAAVVHAHTLETLDPSGVSDYTASRRPVAVHVVNLADRLTRLATTGHALRPLRNGILRLLGRIPAFRRRLAMQLSGLVYR